MIKRILSTALFVLATSATMLSQNVALKTNALYWATTTPNLGIEASVGKKSTLQLFYGLNPWKQSGGDQSSLRHWLVMPEYRYWFCESSMAGSSVPTSWADSSTQAALSCLSGSSPSLRTTAMKDGMQAEA